MSFDMQVKKLQFGAIAACCRLPRRTLCADVGWGATFGAFFGEVLNHFLPSLGITPFACAVVGMATLFTACVRAPLTGIVLAVEMTGRGDLTLPLLSASLMAMLATMVLDSEPIYETLKHRMLEQQANGERAAAPRRAGIDLSL